MNDEEQDSPNRRTRIAGEGMRTRKGVRPHTLNAMERWELYEKPKLDEEKEEGRENKNVDVDTDISNG